MQKKPLISIAHLFGVASLASFLVAAQPSYAAFQWVAPESQAPAGVMTQYAHKQSVAPLSSYPLEPTVIQAKRVQPLVVVQGPKTTSGSAAPAPGIEGDDLVLGFADSVPLTVALRQILPKGYGFSVAQSVSPDTLVSWQGGAAWRTVLSDMVSSADLTMREEGRMIRVAATGKGTSAASVPVQPSSAPINLTALSEGDSKTKNLNTVSSDGGLVLTTPKSYVPVAPAVSNPESRAVPLSLTAPGGITNQWVAQKGQTLHSILKDWTGRANVDLSWQAEYDYPLQATIVSSGSFERAVRQLLIGFQNAQPQPYGNMHRNQAAGQMVLVIRARGDKGVY